MVLRSVHSLLRYVPVGFVLEEVAFHGAIEPTCIGPEGCGRLTAVCVTACN